MNAPALFRTTSCARHAHPEFTLQLARTAVPGLERMIVSYLDAAVARGARFKAGQTVQIGWGTLRVIELMGPGRIRAHVFLNGNEIEPQPGSYLAALNSEMGR